MYGEFIEINVGSRLIKDSQRKYELILDAVLSAGEGVEHGVLTANSLVVTGQVILDILNNANDTVNEEYVTMAMILAAINNTLLALIHNINPSYTLEHVQALYKEDASAFNIGYDSNKVVTGQADDVSYIIDKQIVEPVTIITTMLENSTTVLDLALAKTFHLNSFMNNYL